MIVFSRVSDAVLDTSAHLDAVAAPGSGATALFVGTVRDHDPDAAGEVIRLEYSAHPDAERIIGEIAASLDEEGLRIAVSHRVGALDIGESAIVCAVSSAHRADAFEICRELVERVKAELPVWKKQLEADGTAVWVGLGSLAK
ncbi:molybdenum cofactor biosynthesis protein MoaE [Microbacterium aurantiacum]|uniref:molybdenum cofactor biosynthesis protein MoaE n=1 Tax=Microbacterium aurantiacum TaxID=162393 RepID=UPI000C7FF3F2|nr:molybdenum cofactor biosynthesis protein MoaE [Microbacterium aurantiacum]